MKYETASELVKVICLLNDTDQIPIEPLRTFFPRYRTAILPKDEMRSDLFIALRNVASYFKLGVCSDERLRKALWSEKLRAHSEMKRCERFLAKAEDTRATAEDKKNFATAEETLKVGKF